MGPAGLEGIRHPEPPAPPSGSRAYAPRPTWAQGDFNPEGSDRLCVLDCFSRRIVG
jgi:hypothetical protein